MSPEDELCKRVLQLSGAAGVPPIVGLLLGQAVGRYRAEASPPRVSVVVRALILAGLGLLLWCAGWALRAQC